MQKLHIIQVGDVLVSPDIITEKFCCDLDKCRMVAACVLLSVLIVVAKQGL